jgi:hypothetical protein
VAIGCPTGESARTTAGALVVYLAGGTASDPAAIVGRTQEPELAAVVTSPHTSLLRELVAAGGLKAALPPLMIADSTLIVFEVTSGCFTSIARLGQSPEHFTLPPAATMVLARSLSTLGGRLVSITAAGVTLWSAKIRLRDGHLASVDMASTSARKGARISAGPRAVRNISTESSACDSALLRRTLASGNQR